MDPQQRIFRWGLAIGLWGCALWMARYGYSRFEFIWFLPALVLWVIGISRVYRDLLELAAKPFTAMVDAIIFPRIYARKPAPNYKLAAYYLQEQRFEEAESEFRTILKHYRKETAAYLGLIRLLAKQGERDEASKVFQAAQRHLRHHPGEVSRVEQEWHQLLELADTV